MSLGGALAKERYTKQKRKRKRGADEISEEVGRS
jgi:hypothetical protein